MGNQSVLEEQFRKRLRELREERGWSQDQLANMLHDKGFDWLIKTTISKIEAGKRNVRIDEAVAIADLFQLPLDVLLSRSSARKVDLQSFLTSALGAVKEFEGKVQVALGGLVSGANVVAGLDFEGRDELMREFKTVDESMAASIRACKRIGVFDVKSVPEIKLQRRLVDDAAQDFVSQRANEGSKS